MYHNFAKQMGKDFNLRYLLKLTILKDEFHTNKLYISLYHIKSFIRLNILVHLTGTKDNKCEQHMETVLNTNKYYSTLQ